MAAHYASAVPAAITTLTTTFNNGALTLSWNPVSGATTYAIVRTASPSGVVNSFTVSGGSTSFLDANVFSGTTYNYNVRACDSSGCSAWISTTFTPPTSSSTIPAAPTSFQAVASTTSVTLKWNPSTGATRYDITRNGTISALGNVTSFVDNAVTPDGSFSYGVRACSGNGCSAWVFAPQVTIPVTNIPAAPASINAALNNTVVNLVWSSSAGTSRYELQRNNIALTSGNFTGFTDNTVKVDDSVAYRVRACNSLGCSAWVASNTFIMPPAIPTPVTATANATTINLSWPASTGATSYLVLNTSVKTSTTTGTTVTTNSAVLVNQEFGSHLFSVQACSLKGCSDFARASVNVEVVLDVNKSLFVHDQSTLTKTGITLSLVMDRLANQFNVLNPADPVTGNTLFTRMWDTQNVTPVIPNNPFKCTLQLNGFPIECRPVEGAQAADPFSSMSKYRLIALVNRFDLRNKVNFNDCGEYRMIFSLTNNTPVTLPRNFIIFEAQLPNPKPGDAKGCAPIANFWKDLSTLTDDQARADALLKFYANGDASQNVNPVIHIRNYTDGTGQIRTNQFMDGNIFSWVLKEFKTGVVGGFNTIKAVSVKSNPLGDLFNDGLRTDALAVEFRQQFIANMSSLLVSDLSAFNLTVQNDAHNHGQSHSMGKFSIENDYLNHANKGAFKATIAKAIPSTVNLNADQVLKRATAMTCGGCHQPSAFGLTTLGSVGSNQAWPETVSTNNPNGFVHVSEVPVNGVFPLSPALINVFLPARKVGLETYIKSLSGSATVTIQSATPQTTTVVTGKRSG